MSEGDTLDVSADAHRIVLTPEGGDEANFKDTFEELMKEDRAVLAELANR